MTNLPVSHEEFERIHDPGKVKAAIASAIERMKDPDSLLEGCRQFILQEKRDPVYVVALEYTHRNEDSLLNITYAAQTLLLGWGTRFYSSRMREAQNLRDDLLRLYEANESELKRIAGVHLGEITQGDLSAVRDLFRTFSSCNSIRWTGASKALHVRVPRTFVMWDMDIRAGHHLLHSSHDPVSCYEEFMRTSNDIARGLLKKMSEAELAQRHFSFDSTRFERTLAKMMDEYNYAIIRPILARVRRDRASVEAN